MSHTTHGASSPGRLRRRYFCAASAGANMNDLNVAGQLLRGQERVAYGDAGCQGVHQRPEAERPKVNVAMRPGKCWQLKPFIQPQFLAEQVEQLQATVGATAEHLFRVIERQFGMKKVRYRGLKKNTAHVVTLFALSNLWLARYALTAARG